MKTNLRKVLSLILVALICTTSLGEKVQERNEGKVLAVFIFNFVRLIQWPDQDANREFLIGVVGKHEVLSELQVVATLKKVGDRKLQIVNCQNVTEASKCDVIFVSDDKAELISTIANTVAAEPKIVITDKPGTAATNGGINFTRKSDKLGFEINRQSIEKKGLKISSALTNIGTVVGG